MWTDLPANLRIRRIMGDHDPKVSPFRFGSACSAMIDSPVVFVQAAGGQDDHGGGVISHFAFLFGSDIIKI
jgi:hypothetical protein